MLARKPSDLLGSALPRLCPPLPLHHDLEAYHKAAEAMGIVPMPWQDTAAKYATAVGPDGLWAWREVAIIVGRQNGKTTLTKPLIMQRLLSGRRIMHIAQVRELPRIMFEALADAIEEHSPDLLPRRRGKIIWPRRGAGSESIVLTNGGEYRIGAAITGARGFSFDDLVIDELREMDSFDIINGAKPAQRFSEDPQTIYLSNMGTDKSVILNSLGVRAEAGDPSIAYLEWSAAPELPADDRTGWAQSNPSIGHYPQVLRDLEKDYLSAKLAGNLAGFETEALCRKVPTFRERLVDEFAWKACEADQMPLPQRSALGVSMSPDGTRAAAALAWQSTDGVMNLRMVADVPGSPIDARELGEELKAVVQKRRVQKVGFDPMTDATLAKFFTKPHPISGNEYANASSLFVNLVKGGRLRWMDCESVGDDLTWTARKMHDASGKFEGVRAKDDRPIPAALAAIRAVSLAFTHKAPSLRVF